MAHFYATIRGPKRHKTTTKTSTKSEGMEVHARGWDVGACVELLHVDGYDVVRVYRTAGSNGPRTGHELVAEWREVAE